MRNPKILNVKTPLVVRPPGRWVLAYELRVGVVDAPLIIAIHMQYVHLAQYLLDALITYTPRWLILLELSQEVKSHCLLFSTPYLAGWHIHVNRPGHITNCRNKSIPWRRSHSRLHERQQSAVVCPTRMLQE